MMKKENLISRAEKALSPVLAHYSNLQVSKGKGAYLISVDGKKYLDFSSGIAVTNIGHCHPKVVSAAMKQSENLIHACAGVAYYEQNIALAEKLKDLMQGKLGMSFLGQSGSEAVEAAIKLAKYVTKKQGIIAFKGGFHGRTLGALSITTSKEKYYKPGDGQAGFKLNRPALTQHIKVAVQRQGEKYFIQPVSEIGFCKSVKSQKKEN